MKAVQCYELVVGIALKIHSFMRLLLPITVQSVKPVISAVFQSIIKCHITSYIVDNDLACVQQFGFVLCRFAFLQLLNV